MAERSDQSEGDFGSSDQEVFEWFIERLGGREAALEQLDRVLLVKQLEEAIDLAHVDLIMGHPEINWDEQIALNTPEGRLQIDRLKKAMGQSMRRAFDIVSRPILPDA